MIYVFQRMLLLGILATGTLQAHFQTVIPSHNHIDHGSQQLHVDYRFMHPFEQTCMTMEKPTKAGLFLKENDIDVTNQLKSVKQDGCMAWALDTEIKRPGDYLLYVDPVPYFEPAEGKYIRHLTKTVVSAFGKEEGWDDLIGLKAEIKPLTRPYGLWEGNSFRGQVLYKGQPLSDVMVEVEFYNADSAKKAPYDSMITQVVKTDSQGIFEYVMPFAGWWGFAALIDDDVTITHPKDGKAYPVELGALIWVQTLPKP